MSDTTKGAVKVSYFYTSKDKRFIEELRKHLKLLQRQGYINGWHPHQILAGTDLAAEIDKQITTASIILLLLSSDFMESEYCSSTALKHALERYATGDACVIPIILHPVAWEETPFAGLPVLPADGRPVTSWNHPDEAFLSITDGIRQLVKEHWPHLTAEAVRPRPVHTPYAVNLAHFQARKQETARVNAFIRNPVERLLTVTGSYGVGKTTLIRRVCKELEERGQLPDGGEVYEVDAIIYRRVSKKQSITVHTIFHDLCDRLPANMAESLRAFYTEPGSVEARMHRLLQCFSQRPVLFLLNDFEKMLDEAGDIKDPDLLKALRTIISFPYEHSVKVILLSTRGVPEFQAYSETMGVDTITNLVMTGFSFADTEKYIRALYRGAPIQLNRVTSGELQLVHRLTEGNPLVLQVLCQALACNPELTLMDVLQNVHGETGIFVLDTLIEQAFNGLDPISQYLIQALAIYDGPVSAAAIDFLLRPYIPDIVSETKLNMLVDSFFVSAEANMYTLPRPYQVYGFHSLPVGRTEDLFAPTYPFTRFALIYRASEYFKLTLQDYDSAASVLTQRDRDIAAFNPQTRQLLIRQYRDLYEKIQNPALRMVTALDFGEVLEKEGEYQEALVHYECSYSMAQKLMNRDFEASALINKATIYLKSGMLQDAIGAYEQALKPVQALRNWSTEWNVRNNLGICYFEQGRTEAAIQQYRHVLTLAEQCEDVYGMMHASIQLGNCYVRRGEDALAEAAFNRVLSLYQFEVYPLSRGVNYEKRRKYSYLFGCVLHSIAELLTDQGAYEYALAKASEGIGIDHPQIGSDIHSLLARIYLHSNRLTEAYEEAEIALAYPAPLNYPSIHLLLGIIGLRKGKPEEALTSFQQAIEQVGRLLSTDQGNVRAYDIHALALAGLALCTGNPAHLAAAREAYGIARALNAEQGLLRQINSLFDIVAMAEVYYDEILGGVAKIHQERSGNV